MCPTSTILWTAIHLSNNFGQRRMSYTRMLDSRDRLAYKSGSGEGILSFFRLYTQTNETHFHCGRILLRCCFIPRTVSDSPSMSTMANKSYERLTWSQSVVVFLLYYMTTCNINILPLLFVFARSMSIEAFDEHFIPQNPLKALSYCASHSPRRETSLYFLSRNI